MLRLGRAVLPAVDLDRAVAWYDAALGFGVVFDREIFPGFRSVHVGSGGAAEPGVWLFPSPSGSDSAEPSLVLYADDISAAAGRLDGAGADVVLPLQGEAGSRSLQVRDPSGNVIVIAEI